MPEVELCPGRWVGDHHPVFVIAELGQNHQVISVILSFCIKAYLFVFKGDVVEAKKMIAAAAEAGADCVKLQKSSLKVTFFQLLSFS